METVIHPSRKLLTVFLAYLGISVVSLGYGIVKMSSLLVVLATATLVISIILIHFFLTKYIIAEDGLYQIRKLTGVSFVAGNLRLLQKVFWERGAPTGWKYVPPGLRTPDPLPNPLLQPRRGAIYCALRA